MKVDSNTSKAEYYSLAGSTLVAINTRLERVEFVANDNRKKIRSLEKKIASLETNNGNKLIIPQFKLSDFKSTKKENELIIPQFKFKPPDGKESGLCIFNKTKKI